MSDTAANRHGMLADVAGEIVESNRNLKHHTTYDENTAWAHRQTRPDVAAA